MNLLADVAGDTVKGASLVSDPDAYLADHDLDEEEKAAVKKTLETGDHAHIRDLLPDDDSSGRNVCVNINA
jgi:hypothetical protein